MKRVGIFIETKDGIVKEANQGAAAWALQEQGTELYGFLINEDLKSDMTTFEKNNTHLEQYKSTLEKNRTSLEKYGINHIVNISLSSSPNVSTHGTTMEPGTSHGNNHSSSTKITSNSWNPITWSRAIVQAMETHGISTLFGLTTPIGRDILPRIAALLDAPLVMDCINVDLKNGTAQSYLYSGKTLATVKVTGDTQIYGIRPNVITPITPSNTPWVSAKISAMEFKWDEDETVRGGIKLIESSRGENTGASLLDADVIISGGRGMKNGDNFRLLQELADALGPGAEIGASRVAVDLGWAPYSMQVGQTGEKVSPRLYIACGISGSVQHFAGMKMSKMIIAINDNPNAAIMSNCDYFIEGDLFEIIPALTRALKKEIQKA
ncbi:MAG: electron transfer flavoprotein subunit alpha/FixB family protein [Desulfamplus sp.]|nr:electron transfer flavoprotein subunit alpha/FixB family protein [Desulfamplus sp.]